MGRDHYPFAFLQRTPLVRDWPLSGLVEAVPEEEIQRLLANRALTPRRVKILQLVISNLLLASKVNRSVSYSRDRNYYSARRRYDGPFFTYSSIMWAVEILAAAELIDEVRSKPGDLGVQSRMRATAKLVQHFPVVPEFVFLDGELIRLRDENKKFIKYVDTDLTRQWRSEIAQINDGFANLGIGSSNPLLDFSQPITQLGEQIVTPGRRRLHRIFSKTWTQAAALMAGFGKTFRKQSGSC